MTELKWQIREAGYEALFFLGGFGGAVLPPTQRKAEDLARWRLGSRLEDGKLKRFAERGLVEGVGDDDAWVPRLTSLGWAVLDGGRDVEAAWSRGWDGQWRILMFDLPRQAGSSRSKFWRWLQANHFGKLQGSVWVIPDPFPELENAITDAGLDPSMVIMVAGDVVGTLRPREIVARVWPFEAINLAYREYRAFAERVLRQDGRKALSSVGLKKVLREDRRLWWKAVRPDPLLPKALLPNPYEGFSAWKIRRKLLQKLGTP